MGCSSSIELTKMNKAAKDGKLARLISLHEKGYSFEHRTTMYAAEYGHIGCLRYLHSNGCPWDEKTVKYAALNGHLDCLQYAYYNGCPWDTCAFSFAACNGHFDCLKFLYGKGCPYEYETVLTFLANYTSKIDLDKQVWLRIFLFQFLDPSKHSMPQNIRELCNKTIAEHEVIKKTITAILAEKIPEDIVTLCLHEYI
jgi:hypothetical protein